MPRKSRISDKEFAKEVAEDYISGMSQIAMGAKYGVDRGTVGDWCQDARVQVHISAGSRARENRLKRKIDGELDRRLNGEKLESVPIDLLLKIRKEMLPRGSSVDDKDEADSANASVWDVLDSNPELAAQVGEAMNKDGGE